MCVGLVYKRSAGRPGPLLTTRPGRADVCMTEPTSKTSGPTTGQVITLVLSSIYAIVIDCVIPFHIISQYILMPIPGRTTPITTSERGE